MKRIFLVFIFVLQAFPVFGQDKTDIKNIAIFLQDNVEILDFAGPMEVFVVAGYNVYTVAETTEPLKAMHSLTVVPDYSLENAPVPDIIVFVGGGDIAVAKKEHIKQWVRKMALNAELQLTVCTGAFFLAEVGLLNNKTATTYHKSIDLLQTQFPKIDVRSNVRFVDNGKLITTAGISAGIDGALHMVSKLKGEKFAKQVARGMEYDKWIPQEGLIVNSIRLQDIEKQGFANFIKSAQEKPLYSGEMLNVIDDLTQKGAYAEAEKGIRYVIDHMQTPTIDVYEYLRDNYERQGKDVPMTSQNFIDIIKKEGVKKAEKRYFASMDQFDGWVFVNPEDVIQLAYLDYYLKGDPQTAIEIQQLAKTLFPDNAYVTYVLGVYHEKNKQIDQALRLYKEALKLDPNFAMAKDKLGVLDKDRGV